MYCTKRLLSNPHMFQTLAASQITNRDSKQKPITLSYNIFQLSTVPTKIVLVLSNCAFIIHLAYILLKVLLQCRNTLNTIIRCAYYAVFHLYFLVVLSLIFVLYFAESERKGVRRKYGVCHTLACYIQGNSKKIIKFKVNIADTPILLLQ